MARKGKNKRSYFHGSKEHQRWLKKFSPKGTVKGTRRKCKTGKYVFKKRSIWNQ